MRTSDTYFDYRGTTYVESFVGDDWVATELDGRSPDDFPDAIEFGEGRSGPWVKLPISALTRLWRETVHARWRGADVTVGSRRVVTASKVVLYFIGPPKVARELGMEGDQYMGWSIVVPADEVEVVNVETKELR